MGDANERRRAEQLFAPALGDVWHLVEPAGGRWCVLQCTGLAACLDDPERTSSTDVDGMEALIELELCEECLRRLGQ